MRFAVACVVCVSAVAAQRNRPSSTESEADDGPRTGRVTGIRHWSQPDATRIVIEVDGPYRLRSDRLTSPNRIFFDLAGAVPIQKPTQTITVGDPLLKQIRVAETQPGTTRVVLDLEGDADFKASQLTSPSRLVIELRRPSSPPVESPLARAAPPPVKAFTPPPEPVRPPPDPVRIEAAPPKIRASAVPPDIAMPAIPPPATKPAITRPAPKETIAEKTPAAASERGALPAKKQGSGETSLTRVLGLKLGRVVVDAGHGGHDTGTVGPGGLAEKDLVLDIALRLASLIENRLNSEVVLTRSDDTYVGLERRTQIANNQKADLFISIHANSSPLKSVSGAETYYLNFTTSKSALEVAARENAESERSIHDLQDLVQKIALKEKVEESREFASRVQSSLAAMSARNNSSSRNRGVKKAPFVVLIGASMPAILAEIGFVTNANDEALMRKPEQRQRIAEALYRGISQYASGLSRFQVARRKQTDE